VEGHRSRDAKAVKNAQLAAFLIVAARESAMLCVEYEGYYGIWLVLRSSLAAESWSGIRVILPHLPERKAETMKVNIYLNFPGKCAEAIAF
jgi:hypothetical protein